MRWLWLPFALALFAFTYIPLLAQQQASSASQAPADELNTKQPESLQFAGDVRAKPQSSKEDSMMPGSNDALSAGANPPAQGTDSKTNPAPDSQHKLGSLAVFGSWRFRTEAWDWFQPTTGENAYAFSHSLLFLGVGQKTNNFEWLIEGAQDAILGLPGNAIVPGSQGQLGLGGTYFAANQDKSVIASIYPAGGNAQFGYVETNFRF